ncbi:glycosyltransferase family 9 protein [Aeromonas enteropelogenes]|uniref:glycosyltransferase family 9 protein n=1 Tax=Aeromonas enteropelogenes TaxID=29489 RepID=UPI003BA0F585
MLTVCIFLDKLSGGVISRFISACSTQHEYIIFCDHINGVDGVSTYKKNSFHDFIKNSPSDYFLLMSDDGYLIRIDDDFCKKNAIPVKTIGVFCAYPFSRGYSIKNSFRPEHFFGCILISADAKNVINNDFSFNRWMGHHALISSMVEEIDVLTLPIKSDVLPCITQMKGRCLAESRVNCFTMLSYMSQCDDLDFPSVHWKEKNHTIVKTLLKEEKVDNQVIDEHLSLLTKSLSLKYPYTFHEKKTTSLSLNDKKVVIFRVEHIGDVIISYPLIDSILSSGAKSVKIVTSKSTSFLFEDDPRIESVISVDDDYRDVINRPDVYDLLHKHIVSLRGEICDSDIAIFPQYASDITFYKHIALILGIKCRVGIKNDVSSEGGYYNLLYEYLLSDTVDIYDHGAHEYERISSLANFFGLSVDASSNNRIVHKKVSVENLPEQYIVISLGASCENRRWPVENYHDVIADVLVRYPRLFFVFLGGDDVYESSLSIASSPNSINLCAKLTLRETVYVLSKAILYCGNDSGVMHLASAIGIPVIEISMHPINGKNLHINSPKRFGPYFSKSIVLQPTSPSGIFCHDFCREKHAHCIKNISVSRVVEAIESFLSDVLH